MQFNQKRNAFYSMLFLIQLLLPPPWTVGERQQRQRQPLALKRYQVGRDVGSSWVRHLDFAPFLGGPENLANGGFFWILQGVFAGTFCWDLFGEGFWGTIKKALFQNRWYNSILFGGLCWYISFSTWKSSKWWNICQFFLDVSRIQSSLFPEMLERWYFFGGLKEYS